MRLTPVAAFLAVCIAIPGVRAEDNASAPPAPATAPTLTKLSYDWTVDGIVTGGLAVSTITLLLLNRTLAPLDCKWCTPGTFEGDLSRSVLWSNPPAANTLSNVMQFAIPVGVMGFGLIQAYRFDDPAAGWSDVLLITQATSLAMLTNVIVKYTTGRARPYVWQGNPDLYPPDVSDANVSFFGGHTTFVFAVVVSGSTLFFMQDMPGAPYVLGVGLPVRHLGRRGRGKPHRMGRALPLPSTWTEGCAAGRRPPSGARRGRHRLVVTRWARPGTPGSS
jgi:hypothetical protein